MIENPFYYNDLVFKNYCCFLSIIIIEILVKRVGTQRHPKG